MSCVAACQRRTGPIARTDLHATYDAPSPAVSGPEWVALLNLGVFLAVCVSILTGLWIPSLPVAGALAAGELVLALAAVAWLIATPSAEDSRAGRLVARYAPGWTPLLH